MIKSNKIKLLWAIGFLIISILLFVLGALLHLWTKSEGWIVLSFGGGMGIIIFILGIWDILEYPNIQRSQEFPYRILPKMICDNDRMDSRIEKTTVKPRANIDTIIAVFAFRWAF